MVKKKVKPKKVTKKSAPARPKKKESLNVGYGELKGLASFEELFGLDLLSSSVHVYGRYVWNDTPAFLVTTLSSEAATTTLFNRVFGRFRDTLQNSRNKNQLCGQEIQRYCTTTVSFSDGAPNYISLKLELAD